MSRAKIAVVGTGIGGLSTAYLLGHDHEVHVFEAAGRAGGFAHTVRTAGEGTPVDLGFVAYNESSYPHLAALFRHLEVPLADSEMSYSFRFDHPNLEWGSSTVRQRFAQKFNLARAAFWGMLRDVAKFDRLAPGYLARARQGESTLGELLARARFGRPFVDRYLLPLAAANWSTAPVRMLDFPAETFLRVYLDQRGRRGPGRPKWKTVRGGSVEYVRRLLARIPNVLVNCPVERVRRLEGGVELTTRGVTTRFDAVVFATHPPQTLAVLEAQAGEKEILRKFKFQDGVAYLHNDESVLPRRRALWSAWNIHPAEAGAAAEPVSLSYFMNRRQPLGTGRNWIVTINPGAPPGGIEATAPFSHPILDRETMRAQRALETIQGAGGIFHAGAWTGDGFHEDGIVSAVKVAAAWGVRTPWTIEA